jgi:hypothetical protein
MVTGGVYVSADLLRQIDSLIKGFRYSLAVKQRGTVYGFVFQGTDFRPGEARVLGDVRVNEPQ